MTASMRRIPEPVSDMTETENTREERNATRAELEQLNGLLIRALIKKLESDAATATDIGNAVKVVVHNRVSPKEPEGYLDYEQGLPLTELDFPITDD